MNQKTFIIGSAFIIATMLGIVWITSHRFAPTLKNYDVPVIYECVGLVHVQANSFKDACKIADRNMMPADTAHTEIADDSYTIDTANYYQ